MLEKETSFRFEERKQRFERREVLTSSESFDETSSSSPKVLKHIFRSASLHLLARKTPAVRMYGEKPTKKKRAAKDRFFILFFPLFQPSSVFWIRREREKERLYIVREREERRENPRNEKGKTIRGSAMLVVSD